MKKKRILLLLIILIVTVTVGFALLSATNYILGSSRIGDGSSWNIHWNRNSVSVTSGSVSGSDPIVGGDNDDTVIFTADVEIPGDFYEFTVDAINEGTIDGKIKLISDGVYDSTGENAVTLPSYINYTVTYDDDTAPAENDVLSAGQSKKYKIRVEYDEDAIVVPSSTITYTYKFSVNYEQ